MGVRLFSGLVIATAEAIYFHLALHSKKWNELRTVGQPGGNNDSHYYLLLWPCPLKGEILDLVI